MHSLPVAVIHLSYVSNKDFNAVLSSISDGVGHPPLQEFLKKCDASANDAELKQTVADVVSPLDLMEFFRLDMGAIYQVERGPSAPKAIRLIVGNPYIMQSMARTVPEAAAYAPVTLLIDERPDGVHVSYDTMESLLSAYGDESASHIARDLDSKVKALIQRAI